MPDKHLIVVSVDALVYEDLEFAKSLPMFHMFMKDASIIEKCRTIYPSLTHPVHASIMTGCAAGRTGIISNEIFEVGNEPLTWRNHLPEVRCETIFHIAKRKNLTTASCRWPVTANGNDVIDYLVPEIMDKDTLQSDNMLEVYKKLGTSENVIDIVEKALSRYGSSTDHPEYDDVQIFCAAEIFKKYKPNILFTHPGYVDSERHRLGLFGEHIQKAIKRTDKWLSVLWNAVCEAGLENSTDFVILSDHGHLNICRTISPNVILADKGYIDVDKAGRITDWKAYVMGCGLSAQVYLKNSQDADLYNDIFFLLKQMADEKIYGFEKVFTKDEVKSKYGLYGDFSFVVETDGFTSFRNNHIRPLVGEIDISDYRYGHSTHGHLPDKGPQPVLIAKGPSFKKNVILKNGSVLDYAPTFAKIFGLDMQNTDGKVINEILLQI